MNPKKEKSISSLRGLIVIARLLSQTRTTRARIYILAIKSLSNIK